MLATFYNKGKCQINPKGQSPLVDNGQLKRSLVVTEGNFPLPFCTPESCFFSNDLQQQAFELVTENNKRSRSRGFISERGRKKKKKRKRTARRGVGSDGTGNKDE